MEAIDALKQKVLSLAIQGKLVAQDPTDEPASVLLEKIKAEKAELVKQGKIKKDKQESYIFRGDDNKYYEKIGSDTKDITDEIPFEIPENWEWVRIKNLCLDVFHGRSPKYSKTPTECKIIGQQANQFYGIDLTYIKYGTLEFLSQITDKEYLKKYDVLLNTLGNGTVGRSGIYMASTQEKILTDGHVFIFRNLNPTVSMYFYHYIRERKENIEKTADGTTNQTFLNLSKTIEWLVPLPPLSEQKRIVEEIEKIFSQIEVLKENQEELNKLKDGLKNKVLDLAIQGKLVEQDPNDEPASVLLEKIKTEKTELIKQGKIKKDKQESYIYKGTDNRHYEKIGSEVRDITDEIPFNIPNNWSWCRLGSIVSLLGDGIHGTPVYKENTNYYFINGNNLNDKIDIKNNTKTVSFEEYTKYKKDLNKTSILVSINGTLGNIAFYNDEKIILGKSACYFNLLGNIQKEYVKLIIKSNYFMKYAEENATGSTIKNVSLKSMRDLLLPIPTIEEQKRIVEKLDGIMQVIKTL